MPRPPIREHWVEQIRYEHANWPSKTAIDLAKDLKLFETPDDPAPAEKTVRKYLNEFESLPPERQEEYRLTHWPESFGEGLLPWESSAAILEFLGATLDPDDQNYGRPPIRVALRFWHVTQSVPGWSVEDRRRLTARLLAAELGWAEDPEQLHRETEEFVAGLRLAGEIPTQETEWPPFRAIVRPDGIPWFRQVMAACAIHVPPVSRREDNDDTPEA